MVSHDSESSSGIFTAGQIQQSGGAPAADYTELGRHGYSILGRLTRHGIVWFVKSLDESHRNLTECVARLRKEYEIMLRLNHPGIARAMWFDNDPVIGPAILMELIEGEPLDRFAALADQTTRRAVAVKLLEAMAYVHAQGVCHHDLKPENIMICGHGADASVKIIDFGMSDYRGSAVLKVVGGNRRYGAPEQFNEGYRSDARADVWSLGALIAEMNAGLTLRLTARKAMTTRCDRRPADAGQLLRHYHLLRRRIRLSVTIAAVAVIAALLLWQQPQGSKTSVTHPSPESIAASAPDNSVATATPTPTTTEQPAQDSQRITDTYETEHAAIVSRLTKDIQLATDSLEMTLADESMSRKQRSLYSSQWYGRLFDHINAEFEPLRRRCGDAYIRSREPGWATISDPAFDQCWERINEIGKKFGDAAALNQH